MSNLIRRDPFEDLMRGMLARPVDLGPAAAHEAPQMRVEVKEDAEAYLISAELAGVRKEDIHVHIDGPVVSISAERRQDNEVREGERVLRTERYFGKIARSFQLGQEVDEARSVARFNGGVLELTLAKKTPAQARRLSIE